MKEEKQRRREEGVYISILAIQVDRCFDNPARRASQCLKEAEQHALLRSLF
jgi:hypothetical protein